MKQWVVDLCTIIHTDTWDTDTVKVLGLLNSDWNYSDVGGGFMYDGKEYDLKPTSFIIFDSNKVHCATKIYTNKKRFAIDYAVTKKSMSIRDKFAYVTTKEKNKTRL